MEEEKAGEEASSFWQSVPLGIFQRDVVDPPGEKAVGEERVRQAPLHVPCSSSLRWSTPLSPPGGDQYCQVQPGTLQSGP